MASGSAHSVRPLRCSSVHVLHVALHCIALRCGAVCCGVALGRVALGSIGSGGLGWVCCAVWFAVHVLKGQRLVLLQRGSGAVGDCVSRARLALIEGACAAGALGCHVRYIGATTSTPLGTACSFSCAPSLAKTGRRSSPSPISAILSHQIVMLRHHPASDDDSGATTPPECICSWLRSGALASRCDGESLGGSR